MFSRRLRVKLQGPPGSNGPAVLRPGALVCGEVAFTSPTFDRLSSITVNFRGFSQVNVRSKVRITHQEQMTFFHRQYLIKPESSGLLSVQARQPRTFSFEFIVPETTDLNDASIYPTDDDKVFEDKQHSLPLSLNPKGLKNVKIVYEMYAIVTHVNQASGVGSQTYTPSTISNLLDLECAREALLDTTDTQAEHSGYFQRMSEIHDTPGQTLDNEHHKTMETKSLGPLPTFKVVLKLPSTCVIGRAIPIVATISAESPETERSLNCIERDVSVLSSIQAETHSRCTGLPSRPSFTEKQTQALSTDRARVTMIMGSPFPIACSSEVISSWPPSFKSYFVSRTYSLLVDISMALDGCKDEHNVHFKIPITAVQLCEQLPSYDYVQGLSSELPPAYEASPDPRVTTVPAAGSY